MSDIDDPITDAVLREEQRYSGSWLDQSIPRKLAYIAALLGSVGLVIPLVVAAPTPALFDGETLRSAAPTGMILALVGIAILSTCALCLGVIHVARRRLDLDGEATYSTYVLEDMAGMLAFVPGALAVGYSEFLVLVYYSGQGAVDAYTRVLGADPTVQSPLAAPVPVVGLVAIVAAAGVYALSQYAAYIE
jgi:hypothetical protein